MHRYQLAKIVDWAGKLRSRKRMQKPIFLLQAAGYPLDADYDFHKYGPYSRDVARLTDEFTREGLLEEEEGSPRSDRPDRPHRLCGDLRSAERQGLETFAERNLFASGR